jgi:hypothetical protein
VRRIWPLEPAGTGNLSRNLPLDVARNEPTRRLPKRTIPLTRGRKPDPRTETEVPTAPDPGASATRGPGRGRRGWRAEAAAPARVRPARASVRPTLSLTRRRARARMRAGCHIMDGRAAAPRRSPFLHTEPAPTESRTAAPASLRPRSPFLEAVVAGVGDEEVAGGADRHALGVRELPRARALGAERRDEGPRGAELLHAV